MNDSFMISSCQVGNFLVAFSSLYKHICPISYTASQAKITTSLFQWYHRISCHVSIGVIIIWLWYIIIIIRKIMIYNHNHYIKVLSPDPITPPCFLVFYVLWQQWMTVTDGNLEISYLFHLHIAPWWQPPLYASIRWLPHTFTSYHPFPIWLPLSDF